MKIPLVARLVIANAMLPAAAWAAQPLITDDTGTQGRGGNQLEIAYNRSVEKASGSRTTTHEVPLIFTRGITETLDLYAAVDRQKIATDAATESGWSNPAVGAKWRFYENTAGKFSFALKPEVRFPIPERREARGLGAARTSYALGLLLTYDVPFGAVHANVAAERVDYADPALDTAERRSRYRISVAPVWDVTERWKLALDVGAITNPDRTARASAAYVEIGTIYSPDKNLDLALGVIRNFVDGGSGVSATVGVTWRFE